MKRQPEGIPTGGQFAADRKAEPSSALPTNPLPPAGLEDYPGDWEPAGGGIGVDYTSPEGTQLVVAPGQPAAVIFDNDVFPSDNFVVRPEPGAENLRAAVNEALVRVNAQEVSSELLREQNNFFERRNTQAAWSEEAPGSPQLDAVTICFKDDDQSTYQLTHDYRSGETSVATDREELSPATSARIVENIMFDMARNAFHRSDSQAFFSDFRTQFTATPEAFGLDRAQQGAS